MDSKITALPAYPAAQQTDVLPIVDVGGDATKKITVEELAQSMEINDLDGILGVDKGGTGAATLSGYLKGQGTSIAEVVTIPVGDGGTGQTTVLGARTALLPDQTGQNGKFLKTTGADVEWASPGAPTMPVTRVYTANATWTKPAGLVYVIIKLQGGGGGGGAAGSSDGSGGSNGGTTSFGSHCSATGGTKGARLAYGVSGVGSNGDINLYGQEGDYGDISSYGNSGTGGMGVLGMSGGHGAQSASSGTSVIHGCGGGSGGYSEKMVAAANLGATETVTVGAGGSGELGNGTGAANGGNGFNGIVIVTEYYA